MQHNDTVRHLNTFLMCIEVEASGEITGCNSNVAEDADLLG